MAIQIYDPDESKRQNRMATLQMLQTLGQLAQLPGQIQKSQQEATLAKTQAGLLQQYIPQLTQVTGSTPIAGAPPIMPQAPATQTPGMGFTGFSMGPSGMTFNMGQTPQSKMQMAVETTRQKEAVKRESKQTEQSDKLGRAIKTMTTLRRQFDKALPPVPGSEDLPLLQRYEAFKQNIGSKTGLTNNPQLAAINRSLQMTARLAVRDFGEVGNIPQSDVNAAVESITSGDLNESERNSLLSSFIEIAIARADDPKAVKKLLNNPNVKEMLSLYGIDPDTFGGKPGKQKGSGQADFSKMTTEQLMKRRDELMRKK